MALQLGLLGGRQMPIEVRRDSGRFRAIRAFGLRIDCSVAARDQIDSVESMVPSPQTSSPFN
jgi:hypothetical protein